MEQYQKTDTTNDVYERIQRKRVLHFMNKENRDRAFKILKQRGINARRSSRQGQIIHPDYVEDYVGDVETGFGNTDYKRMFPVLYNLEIRDWDRRRF